ncbi:MAG: hypothetical protein EPN93_21245 [Spirochaetes bacterium]|nr:MAG: hypothetical protein EPN93_21245 [Spirochaetota bacterium]
MIDSGRSIPPIQGMGAKHILHNPVTRLKSFYFVFMAFSWLFLLAAIVLWILLVKDQIARENAFNKLPFILYILLMTLALIFSSLTIMARTGARWSHVSYFLVYLPVPAMLLPIAGAILCGYCLKKTAGTDLPELTFSYRQKRGGTRPRIKIRGFIKKSRFIKATYREWRLSP